MTNEQMYKVIIEETNGWFTYDKNAKGSDHEISADYKDLKNLKKLNLPNIEGIISGKSFYVRNIDLKNVI